MTSRHRYAELHAHSAYSFLDGANEPDDLASAAVELGLEALALTDHDGVPVRVIVRWLSGIPRLTPVSIRAGGRRKGAGLSRQSVVFVCFYV